MKRFLVVLACLLSLLLPSKLSAQGGQAQPIRYGTVLPVCNATSTKNQFFLQTTKTLFWCNGLSWVTIGSGTVDIQTTTVGYTLPIGDNQGLLDMANSSPMTVTLPVPNSGAFTQNFWTMFHDSGPASLSFSPTAPSTLNGSSANTVVGAGTFGVVYIDATNNWRISSGNNLPSSTVSALPTASLNSGYMYVVTDGTTSTDCTVGGGSNQVICRSNGTTYISVGGFQNPISNIQVSNYVQLAEGTTQVANCAPGVDILWGNSASHTINICFNNGATVTLPAITSGSFTSADLVCGGNTTYGLTDCGSIPAANVVTNSTGAAAAANQMVVSSGANKAVKAIDYPERFFVPAANCNNTTAGAGWSIGSGGTVACRAGTNNLGGYITITDTAATFAQFLVTIPFDWDTTTNPYIRFYFASASDTTNGHTVIPQVKVSCPTAGNGTVSDDATFAAAHSSSTVTFGASAVANGFYNGSNVQFNSTDMAGCIAGGLMIVQVGRATDTATGNINFYGADVTFPRLPSVQAN